RSVTFVLARIVGDGLKLYAIRRSGVLPSSSIFINIARLIVFIVGFLVLLQTFGVSITPMLTALGVGGLAIALALQDTLANLFAGLQLLAAKKVRLGDFIRLDSGDEGEVIDINWRNTSLRQLPNNIVIVPNSRLATAIITNFHMPQTEMAVVFQMGVAYDTDLEHVERVTIEVATETMREVPGAIRTFEPFVRYHTFGDSSINFSVILRCQSYTEQYLLKHEFVKRLHKRYRDEGIEIPFPQRTLHFADPAAEETVRPRGKAQRSASKRPAAKRGSRR
ncbi:MAG TPA: mechanosensitive ion channel family protein, partial [Actinomycetota bacterium]|nr:mechanosensitive ion channel family protein [Actinomycetota bacterium]